MRTAAHDSGDRRRLLIELLDDRGACGYQELADALRVSSMTVRREIDDLSRAGLVIKTLGGAQRADAPGSLYESTLKARLFTHRREKIAIAAAAMDLVHEQQTLFLDGSTTCLEFAKLLGRSGRRLTVVTNSALVCLELGQGANVRVIAIGGQFDPSSASYVGPSSEEWAGRFFVDQAFLSTKGFVPAEGTFESSIETFRIKQIIARQAAGVTLLVDHSKFGQRALCRVLDVAQIGTVVTDADSPHKAVAALRRAKKRVVVAAAAPPFGRMSSRKGVTHGA